MVVVVVAAAAVVVVGGSGGGSKSGVPHYSEDAVDVDNNGITKKLKLQSALLATLDNDALHEA